MPALWEDSRKFTTSEFMRNALAPLPMFDETKTVGTPQSKSDYCPPETAKAAVNLR